ncbi:hypothetical protein N7478_012620 [Penicillium angulare]|nr:hypothetical protein N7478_012620 [Penicillium angulare]
MTTGRINQITNLRGTPRARRHRGRRHRTGPTLPADGERELRYKEGTHEAPGRRGSPGVPGETQTTIQLPPLSPSRPVRHAGVPTRSPWRTGASGVASGQPSTDSIGAGGQEALGLRLPETTHRARTAAGDPPRTPRGFTLVRTQASGVRGLTIAFITLERGVEPKTREDREGGRGRNHSGRLTRRRQETTADPGLGLEAHVDPGAGRWSVRQGMGAAKQQKEARRTNRRLGAGSGRRPHLFIDPSFRFQKWAVNWSIDSGPHVAGTGRPVPSTRSPAAGDEPPGPIAQPGAVTWRVGLAGSHSLARGNWRFAPRVSRASPPSGSPPPPVNWRPAATDRQGLPPKRRGGPSRLTRRRAHRRARAGPGLESRRVPGPVSRSRCSRTRAHGDPATPAQSSTLALRARAVVSPGHPLRRSPVF